MTNNKQTAVDSIIELCQELLANHYSISHDAVCSEVIKFCQEKAKEMEKAEKIKFATDFFFWWYNQTSGTNTYEAVEKFYKQTYGGGDQ
jgi:GTP cyclohydrolase FolE2